MRTHDTVRRLSPAAVALALLTAACAGAPDPDDFDGPSVGPPPAGPRAPGGPITLAGPGGPDRPRDRGALFISPHGEPFRSRPGEPYPVAVWFAQADRDHDGRISRDEFRADAEAFFARLDASHDGVIDGFEVADYERGLPEMSPRVQGLAPGEGQNLELGLPGGGRDGPGGGRAGPRGGGGRRGPGLREGASRYTFLDQPEPVTAADADFDSRITLAEMRAAADRRFALLDTDGDGFLTPNELPRTAAQQTAERAEQRRQGGAGAGRGRAPQP